MTSVNADETRAERARDGLETDMNPPGPAGGAPSLGARAPAAWIGGLGLVVLVGWFIAGSAQAPPSHPEPPPAATAAAAQPVGGGSASSDDVRRAHEGGVATSPAASAAIEELRRRLLATPDDRLARKELAVRLVEADRLVEAFEQAQEVLKLDPGDPDGLYVEGEVRLAMGQLQQAVELLDRLLTRYPGHLLGLIARGKAAAGLGRQAEAIGMWQRALIAAGGRYPPVEALLVQAGASGGTTAGGPAVDPVAAHEIESPPQ